MTNTIKNSVKIANLKIDKSSSTPKYQQLVNAVLSSVKDGVLKKGDPIPSINELSCYNNISKATVVKSYSKLRELGILGAFHGKGYYIADTNITKELKIFLMFNKVSPHKKIVYDSFIKTLGNNATVDFHTYNNDYSLFKNLLNKHKGGYTHYVIIPYFSENTENYEILTKDIPQEKLIIIGQKNHGLFNDCAAVYENFERDIHSALQQAHESLRKYHTLKLIFPEKNHFPIDIKDGFKKFCHSYSFNFKIVNKLKLNDIKQGEAYIILKEEDLVQIIKKITTLNYKLGQHVGVISYNENPLKKYIMDGITTISTDFEKMGKSAAELVLNSSKQHIENPFNLFLRSSL